MSWNRTKQVKQNKSHCNVAEDPKDELSEDVKEKDGETEKLTSGENLYFNHNYIKGTTSTPKEKENKVEKLDSKLYATTKTYSTAPY